MFDSERSLSYQVFMARAGYRPRVPKRTGISPRRAATRERLTEAAIDVVAKRGFAGASVDEIAEGAGMSIGALYSNFTSKDELFLAVFDAHLGWFQERMDEAKKAEDPAKAIADWFDSLTNNRQQFMVFVEFWAHAVRNPKLRRQFAPRMAQMRQAVAETIKARAAAAGTEPPLPADLLALMFLAAWRGLSMEKLADPKAVPNAEIGRLLGGLA
jgi:AcrR family transcriptional regulator